MANTVPVPARESLMLPDRITPHDNLELPPPPDAAWLLSQLDEVSMTPGSRGKGRASNRDINLQEDFTNSQYLQDKNTLDDLAPVDDLDLELDFGMDLDERPTRVDRSIEMGRDAVAAMDDDDMFSELLPKGKDKVHRDQSTALDLGNGVRIADEDGDIMMGDQLDFNLGEQTPPAQTRPSLSRARISESPLSDIDEDVAKAVEEAVSKPINGGDLYEPGNEATDKVVVRNRAQRAKKRKLLLPDAQIMLSSDEIREQQRHHDNILKPQSFLPRDPYVLALMEMHKSGGFVSNILLDARSMGWAPELRGLLSHDAVRHATDLKRKRDSGIADMDGDDAHHQKSPRLEIDESDVFGAGAGAHDRPSGLADRSSIDIAGDDGLPAMHHDDDDDQHQPRFDDTTAPIVHPSESGPVSLGTKHAVHILRDLFGSEAAVNADKRKKSAVVFQELLPERTTTKAEATKMFFECLVLATKDAIKVEQPEGTLGGPIRVRGKRGLWGDWAEREAGGEIAHQMDQPEPASSGPSNVANAHVAVAA